MKKFFKIILWGILVVVALGVLGVLLLTGVIHLPSNRMNRQTIGDIPTPSGYERVEGGKGSFAAYLRSLPLKPRAGRRNSTMVAQRHCSS